MEIQLKDLYIPKRGRVDYGDLADLAKDMKDNGQITAITVRPPTDDETLQDGYKAEKYTLVAGGRRVAAALLNGWTSIHVLEREQMDWLKSRILELAENVKRKDMDIVEQVKMKEEILALRREINPEITQAEVARELGETPANFSRDIAVAAA